MRPRTGSGRSTAGSAVISASAGAADSSDASGPARGRSGLSPSACVGVGLSPVAGTWGWAGTETSSDGR